MLLVVGMAALLWGGGAVMGAPRNMRWGMIGLLLVAVIGAHLLFAPDHPLRQATGGSAALWLLLAGGAALVWLYRRFLIKMRAKAHIANPDTPPPAGQFSDTELNRYARHIVLREIGGTGQKALRNAKVLVIGAGGLGSPVLQYLAASGVGTIGVIDDDTVENANLQRQVIHKDAVIGTAKVFSAQREMMAQNPFVTIRPYHRRLTQDIAGELLADYDLVMDGSDNAATRYLVNRTCVAARLPLISGALSQWEGQLSVFDPARGAPCYQCVFPTAAAPGLAPSCAEAGVLSPLPGVVGTMMAVEAIKLITGAGAPLRGQMMIYDALYGENRTISVKPRADCPICTEQHRESANL